MPHKPPTGPAALRTLADRLIIRHLQVSVPKDSDLRQDLPRGREPDPLLESKMRCVAIVGAGASAPLHKRGIELAETLEEDEKEKDKDGLNKEISRLRRVYDLNPKDFETRLAALSRTPEAEQRVREKISKEYAYRHPTLLCYELLAHLLKHRFLDAVISFNFDELLDQCLDDELGVDGYRRLVSERDCVDVVHDPDSSEYLPLYIKLHGTAAEPESIRITRDAYYRLPQKLVAEAEALLESQMTVIANVGSAMTGFDLHRLLRIPDELEIYDLSFEALDDTVCEAITEERVDPKPDSIYSKEDRDEPAFELLPKHVARRKQRPGCDQWLEELVNAIEERSGKNADPDSLAALVRFRSTDRHAAVAALLGADKTLSRSREDPQKRRQHYLDYLRRRTVVELALSGAKARGLAQVSWLAVDRSGAYYDLYRRIGGDKAERWSKLRAAAGLSENKWLPDVVESREDLCGANPPATRNKQGRWSLREFDPALLAGHVAMSIGKSGAHEKSLLRDVLGKLQEGSEVEIQATDDQVCSKAFDAPLTLPTVTALRLFTESLFEDLDPEDEIYISCETGEWLLDPEMRGRLSRQKKVEVLTAFDFKREDLDDAYEGRLRVEAINPWRHNRHMTVVCHRSVPSRAVYFARRLRSPLITPVYLERSKDAARVKRAFDLMRAEEPPLPGGS